MRHRHVVPLLSLSLLLAMAPAPDAAAQPAEVLDLHQVMADPDLSLAARAIALEAFERGMRRDIDIQAEMQRFTAACPAGSARRMLSSSGSARCWVPGCSPPSPRPPRLPEPAC